MPCTAASPSPRPANLVVKKGSKSLALTSAFIPGPVSDTVRLTYSPAGRGEAGLPTLKSDTDLDRLRAIVVDGLGPDSLEDAGLLVASADEVSAAAPPLEAPAPTPAPAPAGQDPLLTAGLSDAAFCDPESVDDYADGAVAILIATMEYEGTPSLVVAYVTGDVENTRIVVLSLETCEVVASA